MLYFFNVLYILLKKYYDSILYFNKNAVVLRCDTLPFKYAINDKWPDLPFPC